MFTGYYIENSGQIPITQLPLLEEFGQVVNLLDYTYILKKKHKEMPRWNLLLKRALSLLTSPINCLQLWGYDMILVLMQVLIEVDSLSVNTNTPHKKGLIFEEFKDVLAHTQEIVQSMLLDFR